MILMFCVRLLEQRSPLTQMEMLCANCQEALSLQNGHQAWLRFQHLWASTSLSARMSYLNKMTGLPKVTVSVCSLPLNPKCSRPNLLDSTELTRVKARVRRPVTRNRRCQNWKTYAVVLPHLPDIK